MFRVMSAVVQTGSTRREIGVRDEAQHALLLGANDGRRRKRGGARRGGPKQGSARKAVSAAV